MLERTVGDVTITRIIESERPDFDAAQFFPSITPEQWAPYRQRLAGWALDPAVNGLVFPMQSFLVRTRHHTIVVDTCVGDHKARARPNWNMTASGEYLKRLAEAGVRPEQVDYVLTTHFHTDHVGWNTRWEGNRIERCFRDVHAATQHGALAPRTLEQVGQARLGVDPRSR